MMFEHAVPRFELPKAPDLRRRHLPVPFAPDMVGRLTDPEGARLPSPPRLEGSG